MTASQRIAIVGGHGKIAQLLAERLSAGGHQPMALTRSANHQADVEAVGASWRLLDIENASSLAYDEALVGADAVVFAAGGGPDGKPERKRTVDLGGSLASIASAERLGIKRFVQISAIGVDDADYPATGGVWEAYVAAKRDADAALRHSSLAWTIIRPGTLTDETPTGLVQLGATTGHGSVARADVAAVLAAVLDDERTIGRQWDLLNGTTPIAEAIGLALSS
jgi:uncharacterized protein YbjT (DUF2867 family)